MIGYGAHPPHAAWPNGARLALQIVMNYEEGSEYSIPDGDETSEMYLTEVPGATVGPHKRDLIVESVYETGTAPSSGSTMTGAGPASGGSCGCFRNAISASPCSARPSHSSATPKQQK